MMVLLDGDTYTSCPGASVAVQERAEFIGDDGCVY